MTTYLNLKEDLKRIKNNHLPISAIKDLLKPYIISNRNNDVVVNSIYFNEGIPLFRGRKLDQKFQKSDAALLRNLSYNDGAKDPVSKGRANQEGSPIFYCTGSRDTVPLEIKDLKCGDEIILSSWKTNKILPLNMVGLCKGIDLPITTDKHSEKILGEFGRIFVDDNEYNISIAVTELMMEGDWDLILDNGAFFKKPLGIVYPSVATRLHGINIAILPQCIGSHHNPDPYLDFVAAQHLIIDQINKDAETMEIRVIDFADSVENENLKWWGFDLLTQHNSIPIPYDTRMVITKPGWNKYGFYLRNPENLKEIYHRLILENDQERVVIE
jgi:hypothetical protein